MSQQIVVGPINEGIRSDRTAFVIDNDSFPTLINAYQWRGRVKRKRGTSFLNRLTRYFNSNNASYVQVGTNKLGTLPYTITLSSGAGNLITGTYSSNDGSPVTFTLSSISPNAAIIPGSVTIVDTTSSTTYTDPSMNGTLTGGAGGTINYATGAITITGGASDKIRATFLYYPDLPVMGLEDLVLNANLFPGTLGFDTTYSYNMVTNFPYNIYDVSFYKNPASSTFGSNTQKTNWTPLSWNGKDYQQFWTTNYEGALWATNGITVPFTTNNIGMQFAAAGSITFNSRTATSITVTITSCPLVIGDFVFVNEWTASTAANAATLNFQSGYVTNVSGTYASLTVTISFPNAAIANDTFNPGIIQYLTNRSDVTKDCIRWYDGDPTNGNATTPTLNGVNGWVNFMPPLSQAAFTIFDLPAAQYYLVGCRVIVPYKDRLLFIGPVVQTSTGTPIYLQDTVIYSQNGTPYYTASFTGSVSSATTTFTPMLTPVNQSAAPNSYFSDQTGFGGYITAGHARPIVTAGFNEDVLILGFSNRQTRFLYTGNDLVPFNFFTVNSEFGSTSTFSSVTLDRGILTTGNNGIIITSQIGAERIDLQIPDQIFEFNLQNNGTERVTAQRDFINEWIYFSYCSNQQTWAFPNQTLQYNYRDKSWAIFNESYTTYGLFRQSTGAQQSYTWSTIGNTYPTWADWNEPWSGGPSTLLQPKVIAGNSQGFIFFREQGTTESNSLYIKSYSGAVFTSPGHTLNSGDYIVINNCIGTISNTTGSINGQVFQVQSATTNTFTVDDTSITGTYLGSGTIQRMYVPQIKTKQFPTAWSLGRKTRIGVQQYLLSKTTQGQITLLIFLSQDSTNAYNNLEFPYPVDIVPADNVENGSLIYSTIVYTSPEVYIQNVSNISIGNIGNGSSTTISFNLQTILNFSQTIVPSTVIISIGSLASFTDNGFGGFSVTGTGVSAGSSISYTTGAVTLVFTVAPPSTASKITFGYYTTNIQNPIASSQQQIWHRENTSLIGDTVQLGFTMNDTQMRDTNLIVQFEEIELHAMILNVSPSQVLS